MIASLFMSFFAGSGGAATGCPITLDEAKAHLKVETTDEDALISGLIDAAALAIETQTGIVCASRSKTFYFPTFGVRLVLPCAPITAVTAVTYVDALGVQQTLVSDQYRLRTFAGVPSLSPAFGVTWPATDSVDGAVSVTVTAGHASNDDIDPRIKTAAKLLIGHWFRNRDGIATDAQTAAVDAVVGRMLSGLRLAFFA